MIDVFIGSTVRSGGSLLARLFDHHPDVASYPFELHLPMDPALHPSLSRRGEKNHVQNHPAFSPSLSPNEWVAKTLLSEDPARCLYGQHFLGGRLNAKSRDLDISARFDHPTFLARAKQGFADSRGIGDVYGAMHKALFETWDDGAHGGRMRFAVYHRANGLFADVGRFLDEFEGAFFIQPVRSLEACLASEKRKVVSQLVSGQVTRGLQVPDRMVRRFSGRFVENTICNWLVVMTRAVVLKERLGARYVLLRMEDLVRRPADLMRELAERIGLDYDDSLARPTNAGHPWAGNSMFGRTDGVDASKADAKVKPSKAEAALIERHAGDLSRWLEQQTGLFDVDRLDRGALFDYELQRRYLDDREKTALHLATLYERWRYRPPLRELLQRKPRPYFL